MGPSPYEQIEEENDDLADNETAEEPAATTPRPAYYPSRRLRPGRRKPQSKSNKKNVNMYNVSDYDGFYDFEDSWSYKTTKEIGVHADTDFIDYFVHEVIGFHDSAYYERIQREQEKKRKLEEKRRRKKERIELEKQRRIEAQEKGIGTQSK